MKSKKNVISLLMNDEELRIVEEAACLSGLSLSDYILSVALKRSSQDLNLEALRLSNQDQDMILELLENPPAPNDKLKGLFINLLN